MTSITDVQYYYFFAVFKLIVCYGFRVFSVGINNNFKRLVENTVEATLTSKELELALLQANKLHKFNCLFHCYLVEKEEWATGKHEISVYFTL